MANLTDTKHPSVKRIHFCSSEGPLLFSKEQKKQNRKNKNKNTFTILLINLFFQNYQVLSHGLGMVNKFGTSLLGIVGSKEELYLTTRGDSN